ncbi:MAG TPA: mechanosensitive ion channel family protein [Candidatus Binataceae bacterium]|nr:mechanosensitive ion channel family protein [Candidatus Binataceae bacterium]
MQISPLQIILGLSLLGPGARIIFDAAIAAGLVVVAVGMRERWNFMPMTGLVMCALGFLIDLAAAPPIANRMGWAQWAGGIAVVLVSWGIIHLLLATADAAAHRTRAHFSTIFKDIMMLTLWGLIVLVVLRQDFHVDLTPLLASTAVVAVVVGLALQESLGNIFSGLTLQLSKPFAPGDWVSSGTHIGRVQGIGWRSTAIITRSNERLEIPNSLMAKEPLINYSIGLVAGEINIGLSYAAAPNYVREVIIAALANISGVMQSPPPEVYAWEYADSAVRYRIKYWMSDYVNAERLRDTVTTDLWYVLRRKAIEIPYPQVRVDRANDRRPVTSGADYALAIMADLRQVDFLHDLRDEELRLLVPGVIVQRFGAGEAIVREHDSGNSLFFIRSGTVEVVATAADGRQIHITDLKPPAFFGEMALMTGEPRTATVRARTDAELLELTRETFGELFKNHPETAVQMGGVIALRMTERRELLEAAPQGDGARNRANWLLAKMRAVFNI